MLKEKLFQLFITIVPLVTLLVISGYFINIFLGKYQTNKIFKATLNNAVQLQNYEISVLNEALCLVLVSENAKKKCEDGVKFTTVYFNETKNKDGSLEYWEQKIVSKKENILKGKIDNFELLLGNNKVNSSVKLYLEKIVFKTDIVEEKELLRMYSNLSNIIYATELEYFLVTYYMDNDIPVSVPNTIFWDKIVEASYLLNIENEIYIPSVKEKLLKISTNDTFNAVLNQIDDMRITILTGNLTQKNKNPDWIVLLKKKLKSLKSMKSIVLSKLNLYIEKHIEDTLWMLFLYISIFLLAFVSIIYIYFRMIREERENKSLLTTINRINALSSYESTESEVMDDMLGKTRNKEDLFAYIYSSFHLLHEKTKQAKDEAESKSQFLSTLSHEIRTPLNGILGFSKLLKDMGTTEDQKEYLSLIEGSSHKLIMIVNDILDLSKINADKMEIENASFDIFEMVESTTSAFIQQTDQKDIELAIFVDPFLSHYFMGDAIKLSQILTNLIGNAVKFTEAYGKISVFVQNIHDTEYESQIKFAVNDNGIGLTEDQTKNIFNAFSQATKSTSNKYGGTGLGLTISQKMVVLMGGKLEVESKVDKGTTFDFTLTLKKDNKKEVKAYPDFSGIHVGLALPVKNIERQLDANMEINMKHLGAKFSVYYYEDLFEGLGFLNLPDVMIFDHHYARLKGELEQCASLDCKTVLLSNGTLRSRINSDNLYFDDILLRPVGLKKCIRILRNIRDKEKVGIKSSKESNSTESFKNITVLVADDNIINRKLIKIILEKIGLDVTLARDGKEAFEKYKYGAFDIILMDIQMPIMSGIESAHAIIEYEKENNLSHVPIVALTANVAKNDRERYLSEGMDDYATKPLEIDKLKAIISKHCDKNWQAKIKSNKEIISTYDLKL